MTERLSNLISEAIQILLDCGWNDQANWFAEIRDELRSVVTPEELAALLSRLDASLAGIGSFDDLPLTSRSGRWTRQQLRELQWSLVERISAEIENLRCCPPEKPNPTCAPQEMNPPDSEDSTAVLRKKNHPPDSGERSGDRTEDDEG